MMNPFDERLPEESEPQYVELTTLLQQAYSRPVSVTPDRQAQILARVRGRLGTTDSESGVRQHDLDIAPFRIPHPAGMSRPHRLSRVVMLIAAVLVMGAFVVTDLLLFQSRVPSTQTHPGIASPIDPLGTPVIVEAQAHGLEATMRVTPGPYFLSEMLKVELSLTNHSHDTSLLVMPLGLVCLPSFPGLPVVKATGGGKPFDATLQRNLAALGCGGPGWSRRPLLPGQTITFTPDIVLTSSGHMTLTTQLLVEKVVPVAGQSNTFRFLHNSDPLAGHWPSLPITVQARVPADRLITGQQKGARVTIDAPARARSQLLYAFTLRCASTGEGSQGKLTTMTLQQPPCESYPPSNPFVQWTYAVGAPGYAVFSGSTHR